MMRRLATGSAAVVFAVLISGHVRARQACEFHVTPAWILVAAAGQGGTLTIDTQPGCAWSASVLTIASAPWITADVTSGLGPATITYSADPFPAAWTGSRIRQARIQVRWDTPTLGQDVVFTQQDGPCGASFAPANQPVSSVTFGALAGTGAFTVVANPANGGAWFMQTSSDWIGLSPFSGVLGYGSGTASFIVAANPGAQTRVATVTGCDGSTFTIRQAGRTRATGHYVQGDFDGDGKADLEIFRGDEQTDQTHLFVLLSGSDFDPRDAIEIDADHPSLFANWSTSLTGDLDGDGRSEAIGYFPGTLFGWGVRYSTDNYSPATATSFRPSDPFTFLPIVADFDGSGKASLATYDTSTGIWRSTPSAGATRTLPATQWGHPSDAPVAADYDGDGITDLAVWRPTDGRWYILDSSTGYDYARSRAYQWGHVGDIPFTGDFDGDGRSDLTVYRPSNGTWYISFSSSGYDPAASLSIQWGAPRDPRASSDIPVPADYDGDGRMDLAVWRPSNGTWYILFSSSHYAYAFARAIQWGHAEDGSMTLDGPVGPYRNAVPLTFGAAACSPESLNRQDCVVGVYASYPDATGIKVFGDLHAFGLSAAQPFPPQITTGGSEFELEFFVPSGMTPGLYSVPLWATDSQGRSASTTVSIRVGQ